jgi:uncharacterized protein (DUF362 family)
MAEVVRTTGWRDARTLGRRPFLRVLGAAAGAAVLRPWDVFGAPAYRVGMGQSTDAYAATMTAITECGEWPAGRIAGRTVLIKTNLVLQLPTESGGTTSPEVVRALVDLSLATGATRVVIMESAKLGEGFRACGYEFFRTYDPLGRVSLYDLSLAPATFTRVPGGTAYGSVYLPTAALDPNAIFISAGKLKTHVETGATLSLKNLFGLPPIAPYYDPAQAEFRSRYRLHDRSVNQAIVDLALARRIDFAVVDGTIGMEGDAPDQGTPVSMDLVLAGRNAVAVDRVSLAVMQVPQDRVQHLAYAAWRGLGPASLTDVEVRGSFKSRAFLQPVIPPIVWLPWSYPSSPGVGQQSYIGYRLSEAAETCVEIVRVRDQYPVIEPVRMLSDWTVRAAGQLVFVWDGRDTAGAAVPAGTYAIRARARRDPDSMPGSAIGWLTVTA